jgi:hypothetical protein
MVLINGLSFVKALEIPLDPFNLGMSIAILLISGLGEIASDIRRKSDDFEENNIKYIKMIDDKEEEIIAEDI